MLLKRYRLEVLNKNNINNEKVYISFKRYSQYSYSRKLRCKNCKLISGCISDCWLESEKYVLKNFIYIPDKKEKILTST